MHHRVWAARVVRSAARLAWAAVLGMVLVGGGVGEGRAAASSTGPNYAGTAGLLRLGASARSLALGGAGVAAVTDGSAIFYNPAALANADGAQVSSLYANQFGAAEYWAVGATVPGWGAGLLRLAAVGNEYRDAYGNPLGTFDQSQTAIVLGGARQAGSLAVGAAAKYYAQVLPGQPGQELVVGQGLTLDVGVLLKQDSLTLGAVARNLTGVVRQSNGTVDPFDSEMVVGMAWRRGSLLWVADFAAPGSLRAGVEVQMGPAALRLGGWTSRESSAMTAGLGLSRGSLSMDYAIQLVAHLPASHRFSAGIRF